MNREELFEKIDCAVDMLRHTKNIFDRAREFYIKGLVSDAELDYAMICLNSSTLEEYLLFIDERRSGL